MSTAPNRLSGNAITEALVLGWRAGAEAARAAAAGGAGLDVAARAGLEEGAAEIEAVPGRRSGDGTRLPVLRRRLQQVMSTQVGPVRDAAGLEAARDGLAEVADGLAGARVAPARRYNLEWVEFLELRMMLRVAEVVRRAAGERRESRGAHQREDFPEHSGDADRNGVVGLDGGVLTHRWVPVTRRHAAAAAAGGAGG